MRRKAEIEIRHAREVDLDELERLYDNLNDYLAGHINYPGWKKGIYPIREDAEAGIKEQSLFVAVEKESQRIAGSLILRHKQEDAYKSVEWQSALEDSEVFVIYTFVIAPEYQHCGIGQMLLEFADEYARKNNAKALRLDVYEKNVPAIRLYKKCGFKYIGTVSLGLEKFGLDWFDLYEKTV